MALSDRRLTGRDVLAKTFHAKTKKGYDPIEVDAYLELVAAQIDVLHGDIGRLDQAAPVVVEAEAPSAPSPELQLEVERLREALSEQASQLSQEQAVSETLRAENEQLRAQLTAIAPPPPVHTGVEEAPVTADVAAPQQDRASEESYELVLRMAHRTAEDTISQAHARADEIVAEAEFNADQIAKESDRKAFETANRVQAEIASLNAEIENQQSELADLRNQALARRDDLRGLAQNILAIADGDPTRHPTEIDLRGQNQDVAAESPA